MRLNLDFCSILLGIAIGSGFCMFLRALAKRKPIFEANRHKTDFCESFANVARKNGAKMALVVRNDLGMSKGKAAAQIAHASLACYKQVLQNDPKLLKVWENDGQAKVTLQVSSEEQLELLYAQALSLGLIANIVHDAGRTQIAAGSATCMGIGPGPINVINQVTGSLKLY